MIESDINKRYCQSCGMPLRFDIEKYLKRRKPIVSKHEVFDYYKIDLPQEAAGKQEKEEF